MFFSPRFLTELGKSDVINYYWYAFSNRSVLPSLMFFNRDRRVSRNARQKSVIERNRLDAM